MPKWIWPIALIGVLLVGGGVFWLVGHNNFENETSSPTASRKPQSAKTGNEAVQAGKRLAGKNCTGQGPGKLTRLPMDESDFSMIIPYGLMIGGHVTPIDHQYFSPTVFNSPRDTYPVYAMADSKIVEISQRTNDRGTEYRFVMMMTCTFFYYFDLVTSLAPEIKTSYDKNRKDQHARLDIDLTAGQLVGRIGGQTLDFAVWDTTKPLKGFVVPEHYSEPWKLYTADPLDYYTPEIKTKALAKYLRDVEPISGKIDYDIDGKLIGNWFLAGSGGYGSGGGPKGPNDYWAGHLSISPDYLDPTAIIFSIGAWNGGEPKQWLVAPGSVGPATVGVETGVVRYELSQTDHTLPDGRPWDRDSIARGLKAVPARDFGGCVFLQLTESRKLKLETFPNQKCAEVAGFTAKAVTYER